MPFTTCLSNILTTRFEFGVPLEDIFPPDDIHPRLKYLFESAFESYMDNGCNIVPILRYNQGTISESLMLKDKLVHSMDYHLNIDFCPGAYFWVIRHFLGLLPLPVLPRYTKGIDFDWNTLADECKISFKSQNHSRRNILDLEIAQTINKLPVENYTLLHMIIYFLRKISSKKQQADSQKFNRPALMALINYYCSSLFERPFRPGHFYKSEYRPLLLYLIVRWYSISRHCYAIGHPTYVINSDKNMMKNNRSFHSKDNGTQTSFFPNVFFNPEVINVCKNNPYLVNVCDNYLKHIACQTETDLCKHHDQIPSVSNVKKKGMDLFELATDTNKISNANTYKLAYIEEELEDMQETAENDVQLENKVELLNDIDLRSNVELENDNTLYQTAADFVFSNSLEEDEKLDWKNIMKETTRTVKKLEESYIYDDYETFKKEEFNQIGKNRSSLMSNISRYGYTSSKNSPRKAVAKSSTPKKISPESDNTYMRYPDVFTTDDDSGHSSEECGSKVDKNRDSEEVQVTDHHIKDDSYKHKIPIAQKLFQNNSPTNIIQGVDSKQNLQEDNAHKKRRRKYILEKLRITLDFLRTITPTKSTFKMIESKVKYSRIRNTKFHTI